MDTDKDRKIINDLLESTVRIQKMDQNGNKSIATGFFVDKHGILTNHHVVDGAQELSVLRQHANGNMYSYPVNVLCSDPNVDFAYLIPTEMNKNTECNKRFEIGRNDMFKPMDQIYVIGYDLAGMFDNIKIMPGVINGVEKGLLQHQADTNPGMSGSAIIKVINNKPYVIAQHHSGLSSQNYPGKIMFGSFIDHIPIKQIQERQQTIRTQHQSRIGTPIIPIVPPEFPFQFQPITPSIRQYYAIPDDVNGVMVKETNEHFKQGDIVMKMNNQIITADAKIAMHQNSIHTLNDLSQFMQFYLLRETIPIEKYNVNTRQYSKMEIPLKFPNQESRSSNPNGHSNVNRIDLGPIRLENVSNILESNSGVFVRDIQKYSMVHQDNLLTKGSIITKINDIPVKSVADIDRAIHRHSTDGSREFITFETKDHIFYPINKKYFNL